MTSCRRLVCACFVLVPLLLALPAPAWACTCVGFTTLEQVTREPGVVVLVGRVAAVGGDRDKGVFPDDPKHVDVDVTWVAKGSAASSTRIRVWNLWAGTSCGGSLKELVVGSTAVLAGRTAPVAQRTLTELWEALNLQIPPEDFVITTSCGQAVQVLRTAEELDRYVGRKIP